MSSAVTMLTDAGTESVDCSRFPAPTTTGISLKSINSEPSSPTGAAGSGDPAPSDAEAPSGAVGEGSVVAVMGLAATERAQAIAITQRSGFRTLATPAF